MDRTKVVCLGMAVVDVLIKGLETDNAINEDTVADSISMETGGDALNQSIVISKLGNKSSLISLVGDDYFGRFIKEQCDKFNIEHNGITISNRCSTSTSVVCINNNGERNFISHKNGSVNAFSIDDIDLKMLDESVKILSIGSLCSNDVLDKNAYKKIFEHAKSKGITIVADMVNNIDKHKFEDLKDVLYYIDYLVPSKEEVEKYTGIKDPSEGAYEFYKMGVKNIIVKLGKEGSLVYCDTFKGIVPAYKVNTVDTTGAGDNFVAGFISALLDDKTLLRSVKFASAVAALSVQEIGAQKGVKDKTQVDFFLINNTTYNY